MQSGDSRIQPFNPIKSAQEAPASPSPNPHVSPISKKAKEHLVPPPIAGDSEKRLMEKEWSQRLIVSPALSGGSRFNLAQLSKLQGNANALQIEDMEVVVDAVQLRKAFPQCSSVEFSTCTFSEEKFIAFCQTLQNDTFLEVLKLKNINVPYPANSLSEAAFDSFCAAVMRIPNLQTLVITGTWLTESQFIILLETLTKVKHPSMTFLEIRNANILDKGVTAMAEFLKSNDSLEKLSFGYSAFVRKGVQQLIPGLKENIHLQNIDLSGMILSEEEKAALSQITRIKIKL